MLTPANFHNYQVKAFNHSMEHYNSMLWLFLGSGKTSVSLTTVVERMDNFQVYGTLVVAPLRVAQSVWEPEARKWSHTQHLSFNFIHGEECEKIRALNVPADIYVINYEGLMWLSEHLTEHYLKRGLRPPFNMLIADEVTKLKNAQSLRHEALRTFLLQMPYRMGLTATPASNGYKDLFGQYLAIDAGERLGLVEKDYKDKFFNKCGYMNKDIELRTDSKDMILEQISDITLQMNAEDYLELPPVTFNDVYIPMEGRARQQYEKMERDLFIELDSGVNVEIANAAGLTNKLLQFSNGAIYLNPGEPEWSQVHKLKLDALDDIIEEAGHNPVLCFYQFQHDRQRIMKKYPHAEFIKSGMPKTQVNDIINRWNAGLIELLIGHGQSLAYGLNLQKAFGSMIVWFGLPWSLEVYLQANARIARQGVGHHVVINRLIMQFTMDEAVAIALRNKAETENDLRQSVAEYRKIKLGLLDL